ncbi:MAG TPA: hypothetical protein VLA31_00400 [Burkholderiaceae bacterium]|nr:hypothetical protein [Burkholderiaceae bacterium]
MTTQPEALRLADELEAPVGTQSTYSAMQQAAAELRRLHEESDLRASAADKLRALYREERMELLRQRDQATAQRDALLEALKRVLDRFEPYAVPGYETNVAAEEKARAAIAAVEGEKS